MKSHTNTLRINGLGMELCLLYRRWPLKSITQFQVNFWFKPFRAILTYPYLKVIRDHQKTIFSFQRCRCFSSSKSPHHMTVIVIAVNWSWLCALETFSIFCVNWVFKGKPSQFFVLSVWTCSGHIVWPQMMILVTSSITSVAKIL